MRTKFKIKDFYILFLFLIGAAVLVYIFPKEKKFRYEFKKGTPWMHKELIAPFDFSVYKQAGRLKAEKDSLKNNAGTYFRYNAKTVEENKKLLDKKFEEQWNHHVKRYYRINKSEDSSDISLLKIKRRNYYVPLINIFNTIYNKGVIKIPAKYEDRKNFSFYILNNNLAEEYSIEEVFTSETALAFLEQQLTELTQDSTSNLNPDFHFYENINFTGIIKPNLDFDNEVTKKFLDEKLRSLSLTDGLIQKGERIISRGEIVNDQKLKVLNSLKREFENLSGGPKSFYFVLIGHIIIVLLTISGLYLFLFHFRKEILQSSRKALFILLLVVLFISSGLLLMRFTSLSIYIIPFTLVPIVIRSFYDSRIAIFTHIIIVLTTGFFVPNGYEFVFIQIISGIAAVFSLAGMHRRRQLFITAFIVILVYSLIYFGISIIQEGDIYNISTKKILWFAINGSLLLFAYPLIYIFEKLFGFLSDVSLMELSSMNHPILRELNEKAPGTFQHSLQVANLAEEAIYKIGGNPLLARTGALFHDIGKMSIPHYFIENQVSGNNPHDELEYLQSAEIIISHVHKGIEKAKKNRLPKAVTDFIRTHHGTTKVQYFFRMHTKENPDEQVDESLFTYPGPKPFSKETCVVMMSDSVEAASRSLKEYTEESISNLVENIVNYQIKEEQFSEADITFKNIYEVKKVLKKKLKNIYHARIEYPKEVSKN